jgi:hypothetical protein
MGFSLVSSLTLYLPSPGSMCVRGGFQWRGRLLTQGYVETGRFEAVFNGLERNPAVRFAKIVLCNDLEKDERAKRHVFYNGGVCESIAMARVDYL